MLVSLFIVGVVCGGFSPARSADYYVTPTPPSNPACPSGAPCHTLDDYAVNASQLFGNEDNVTLIFLDGFHELNHDFEIRDLRELVITDLKVNNNLSAYVFISSDNLVAMSSIKSVTMEKLNVSSKSDECIKVQDFENLEVNQMTLNFCSMDCLHSYSPLSSPVYIKMSDSIFNQTAVRVINAQFFTTDVSSEDENTIDTYPELVTMITNCNGEERASISFVVYKQIAQISIIDTITADEEVGIGLFGLSSNTSLIMMNCTMTNNDRSGLYLLGGNADVDITLVNSTFEDSKRSGVSLGVEVEADQFILNMIVITMTVHNCTFQRNLQGIDIRVDSVQLNISNTVFQSQGYSESLYGGGAVGFGLRVFSNHADSSVTISDSMFQNNQGNTADSGVVQIVNCERTIFEGTNTFSDNLGTPVQVYLGDLFISGELTFKHNVGNKGGAISLSSSQVFLHNRTNVTFDSNYAKDEGGAIYVNTFLSSQLNYQGQGCFYQLPDVQPHTVIKDAEIRLTFVNNSAANGGVDIYGAALRSDCSVLSIQTRSSLFLLHPQKQSRNVYREIFNFEQTNKTQLSSIASDPTRVCLCNETGEPQCATESYIFSAVQVYPGEEFTLPAVAVGLEFGSVSGSVYAGFLPLHSTSPSLGVNQDSQSVLYTQCNTLTYTVFSKPSTEEVLVLTATPQRIQEYGNKSSVKGYIQSFGNRKTISDALLSQPVFVNVTLQQCPLVFELTEDPPYKCTCHNRLTENGINNCLIANHTGKVYRSGTVWVSASFRGNESDDIVIDKNCPYNYCREENIPVELQYPDIQCAFGHSGVLCGGCPDNYSLAIGSSACLYCPNNNYLSLLVAFTFAGFALVLFIKVFDLTVSKGTINGFIFYANIVWVNRAILFPQESNPGLEFLRVFIAWLNLDWGIETCFSQGLNGYGKVWLQFVFPIYIWLLAGFIVLLCRYSTTATRLFGRNSISVLATLFLISYAKLLRTIITALGYSVLQYSEGSHTVWSFDGNVDYFSPAHSILFVASLITLIFLWFPYTLIFLLIQFLRKVDHYRILRWTVKYKPFFDTYTGPFKDKHHYWMGLLLLVRVLLLIIVAITTTIAPTFNLVAIVVSSAVLLFHPYVYKKWYLTILESSFFLNLAITAAGILYVDEVNKSQVIYPSVGIVFIQFIVIVGCHLYILFRPRCNKFKTGRKTNINLLIQFLRQVRHTLIKNERKTI